MKPSRIIVFLLLISCSNLTIYSYEIKSKDIDKIDTQLVISIEYLSDSKLEFTVQSFPISDKAIESYSLVFDMQFREDYENDTTGVCIGPNWEKFGPGEFTIVLEKENNFKNSIFGEINLNEDDRCKNYFYYLRFLTINLRNKDQILIGVATDYAKDYPDAPFIWLVNKNNQLEEIGTTNIEKYSLNFELSK